MNISSHYKISTPQIATGTARIFFNIGLTVPFIVPIHDLHQYNLCKNVLNKSINMAERLNQPILQAFFIGIASHFIGDIFFSDDNIEDVGIRRNYVSHFNVEIDKFINKNQDVDNEVTRSINNYFNVEDITGSISNLYNIHRKLTSIDMDMHSRSLTDYLFISKIIESMYSSLMFF